MSKTYWPHSQLPLFLHPALKIREIRPAVRFHGEIFTKKERNEALKVILLIANATYI